MSIQAKRVDLSEPWEKADYIKKVRANQALIMEMLKDHLCLSVRYKVMKDRTDVVLSNELRIALRSTLERAGFSADRKTLEKYL